MSQSTRLVGSRNWLRALAQLAAWGVLVREGRRAYFLEHDSLAPWGAAALGVLVVLGIALGPLRARAGFRALVLPALLPIVSGAALAIALDASLPGETFESHRLALLDDADFRYWLLSDGFRGGVLVLCAGLTAVAWLGRPPPPRALPFTFGLRASAFAIAVVVIAVGWPKAGRLDALVLLPLLLGVVALAELVGAPRRESALVFGVMLSAALLAQALNVADYMDSYLARELAGQMFRGLLAYLPAPLLAFGLAFRRRRAAEAPLSALPGLLVPPITASALCGAFLVFVTDFFRLPDDYWVRALPAGFEPVPGAARAQGKQRPDRVLIIGEQRMTRGGADLGLTAELDKDAFCSEFVERLKLTPTDPLVFSADRRLPLARLNCLLGALTRSVRDRSPHLDPAGVQALCTAHEVGLSPGEFSTVGPSILDIPLSGEGCPAEVPRLVVLGRDWSVSSVKDVKASGALDAKSPACPLEGDHRPQVVPVALSRDVPDVIGHQLLRCGFAPSVKAREDKPAPAPPPSILERLSVAVTLLSPQEQPPRDEVIAAIERCYAVPATRPKRLYSALLALKPSESGEPEIWHVGSDVENEGAAQCVRSWARGVVSAASGPQARDALMLRYDVTTTHLALRLTPGGGPGAESVPQAVVDKLPDIQACYERALQAHPEVEGALDDEPLKVTLNLNQRQRVLSMRSLPKALDPISYCVAPLLLGLDLDASPSMIAPTTVSFTIEASWIKSE